MSCRTKPSRQRGPCYPIKQRFGDLDSIVHDYIERHRQGEEAELDAFRRQPSLRECIRQAGLARRWDEGRWKRLDHQRRIPPGTLRAWTKALLRKHDQIRSCHTFEALISMLETESRKFWRNGELTVYDAALRIGAYRKLEPEKVYLHAGTRKGARYLRLDGGMRSLAPDEFDKAFSRLKPYQIEDCLCLYAKALKSLRLDGPTTR